MTDPSGHSQPRWKHYVLEGGSAVQGFWSDHCEGGARQVLYVLAKSFDPRTCDGIELLLDANGAGVRDVLRLDYVEGEVAKITELREAADSHGNRLLSLLNNRGQILPKDIQFYAPDGRRIVSQSAADVFLRPEDLAAYTDVVVDISGMPRSVFFPLIARLLHLIDSNQEMTQNLFVTVSEDPGLDARIAQEGVDEFADYLAMFRGGFDQEATADRPKVWIPLLGESRLPHLERIYDLVKPDEVCPVLPSPSRNPRRGDNLVSEYREVLFEQLRVDPHNFIYAAEQNPFEVYLQIRRAVLQYRQALEPLGSCKVAISSMSSKLMSLGGLLAAYELKKTGIEVGVAHVDCQRYSLKTAVQNSEPFVLWLAGECYAC